MECAVIDPGDESNAILDYLEDNHLKCRVILITHGHYDHVGAVLPVMEETGAHGIHQRRGLRPHSRERHANSLCRRAANFTTRATRSRSAPSPSG
jgi:glyoxylase-like metal-dependent hydrolase (beta-lactamase superfamily II)